MESKRDFVKRIKKRQKRWLKDPKNKEFDIYICNEIKKLIIEELKERGEDTDSIKFERAVFFGFREVRYRYVFFLKDGTMIRRIFTHYLR